jgi:hypothetical protein
MRCWAVSGSPAREGNAAWVTGQWLAALADWPAQQGDRSVC